MARAQGRPRRRNPGLNFTRIPSPRLKSTPDPVDLPGAVDDTPFLHRPTSATTLAGQVLAIGDAARWPDWLEALVTEGHRVEVVPDSASALVRSVERVIDVILVAADTALDEADALEKLRRLSPCTRLLLIGDRSERGAATRGSSGATDEPVRALASTLGAGAFVREIRASVQSARVARERRERIDQLRSLVNRIQDPNGSTGDLKRLLEALPAEGDRPVSAGFDSLRRSLARDLDPLQAARETNDFIAGCLPDAVVAVWLAGPGQRVGLAACGGGQGSTSDFAVRFMARVERAILPGHMVAGGIKATPDASEWGQPDDAHELDGRWAMLAPCRSDGCCHAVILLLGARGPRPAPAEGALDAVRQILGQHLARIERVNLRCAPTWPDMDGFLEPPEDPHGHFDDPGQS